jgi:outer membrane protein assembly factor BamB
MKTTSHPGHWGSFPFLLLILTALAGVPGRAADRDAAPVLKQIGVTRGICALPGDAGAALALALARQSELTLYVQLPAAGEVAEARQKAAQAGFYGTRIYVEQGPLNLLFLADNIADAVVAVGAAEKVSGAEALRVVRPAGKVVIGGQITTKPFPAGVDDWSHPYHLPDNNPVSNDQLARGPYLTQFLADPRYAPLPQVAVAAAGRIFKAFGHIAFKEREEPWLNTLAAFNGYNGTLLWRKEIPAALMVHRSTLIATADRLYFGDDKSCKVYDAATGAALDDLSPPEAEAGGAFWKWMALEGETMYALVGPPEKRDPVIRAKSTGHGWPWNPLSPGFNQPENPWGYGKTLLAMNVKTKQVLWSHKEEQPMDGRALCLKSGRLYLFSHGYYLAALDAANGHEIWRHTPATTPDLFAALGPYLGRQDWRTNWRTTALMRAGDKALYFAGPAMAKLTAVATETGRLMWTQPYDNYQLVLREDGLYGISGQIDKEISRKFDPLTGKVLAEIAINRRACTRPTASADAIFFRAGEGSVRLDTGKDQAQLVSPMRPNCHDGVTIANGLLYWWPSVCDCNLTLYGITCLGPAGNFDFSQPARAGERLVKSGAMDQTGPLTPPAGDWPVFRANNQGTVASMARVVEQAKPLWTFRLPAGVVPTAPTAAGDLVFCGGSDGIARALKASNGQPAWTAFTGGELRLPPTLAEGRAYAGSADGWVYCWQASDGALQWKFRAAPMERRIPVYGTLQSTWPAASGVLVQDGVALVAAGLANYDGTHVYALDASTGVIKWQNNTSGHLDQDSHTGVGVQGHLLIHADKLYMAGGNAVSPAIYDIDNGACLNQGEFVQKQKDGNLIGSVNPRGWELYRVADSVRVAGKPYYAPPQYPVFDDQVLKKTLYLTVGDVDVAWVNNEKLMGFANLSTNRAAFQRANWGKPDIQQPAPRWSRACKDSRAVAAGANAVIIATAGEVIALRPADGEVLWKHALPAAPVPWGLALTRAGRVIVTLEDGRVLCFG